ncbi:MAG: glycosyltransferase family 4 protein [Firmicutes bacterium]|nr:glycosyltransferase family 4 protein [Bacillota bacterium]
MSLKIVTFTDSYLPYNSGVVHSIETLMEELSSWGHKILVCAPRYPNCIENSNIFRITSVPSPTDRDYYLALPFSGRVNAILKTINPDIIHVHHPFGLGWMGKKIARRLGIPVVYTCHTFYEFYNHYVPINASLANLIIRKVYKNFCNQCDTVIAPTAITRDYLRHLGVITPVSVIPTGIKTEKFIFGEKGWLRKRYGIAPEEKILLCVGRLGKEKNMSFIIECFAAVNKEFPETKLVMVGKGPQKDELECLAQDLGVREKVIFTGLLSKEEVIKCYRDSHLFVFASVSETQGLVVSEAKSAGLPIIAVKANGVSEMVHDGVDGFLTKPSQEAFLEKIMLLLENDDLRQQMSRKARENSKMLSSKNYAYKVLKVYLALVDGTKTGTAQSN